MTLDPWGSILLPPAQPLFLLLLLPGSQLPAPSPQLAACEGPTPCRPKQTIASARPQPPPGRTGPPRLSVSPSLAKSSQVQVPTRAQILAPLVCIPVLWGQPSPNTPRLHLPAHPPEGPPSNPPRPPIHQSTLTSTRHQSRPDPSTPASRHPPAAKFATARCTRGQLRCRPGPRCDCTSAAPVPPSVRLTLASTRPNLGSPQNPILPCACLPAVDLVFIWRQSDRFSPLPFCKTSTQRLHGSGHRPPGTPLLHPHPVPNRQSAAAAQPPARDTLTGLLSLCLSHLALIYDSYYCQGVLLYCRALKPTKQASHRIAQQRTAIL